MSNNNKSLALLITIKQWHRSLLCDLRKHIYRAFTSFSVGTKLVPPSVQLFLSFIPHKNNKWVYIFLIAVGQRRNAMKKLEEGNSFYINTWKGASGSRFVVKSKMASERRLGWMVKFQQWQGWSLKISTHYAERLEEAPQICYVT